MRKDHINTREITEDEELKKISNAIVKQIDWRSSNSICIVKLFWRQFFALFLCLALSNFDIAFDLYFIIRAISRLYKFSFLKQNEQSPFFYSIRMIEELRTKYLNVCKKIVKNHPINIEI